MDILGITMWREARGVGEEGMRAVYHVIHNRSTDRRWRKDMEEVCLQPFQFSCWNTTDLQRDLYPTPTDPLYLKAMSIIDDPGQDPTGGANTYYDSSITAPSYDTPKTFKCQIGKLRFHEL